MTEYLEVGPSKIKVGDYCLVIWKGVLNDAKVIEVAITRILVEFETSSRRHHRRWQRSVYIPSEFRIKESEEE